MNECFKKIIGEIRTTIDDTVKIMRGLNISIFDNAGNIKSLECILTELQLKGYESK